MTTLKNNLFKYQSFLILQITILGEIANIHQEYAWSIIDLNINMLLFLEEAGEVKYLNDKQSNKYKTQYMQNKRLAQ